MANNPKYYLLLLLYLFSAALIIQAVTSAFVDVEISHHLGIMAHLDINHYCGAKARIQMTFPHNQRAYHISSEEELNLKGLYSRRLLIGSVAPTCTYNECKGCKYKCRAEQVPVEGNDPMNSPYHYKCVCHR